MGVKLHSVPVPHRKLLLGIPASGLPSLAKTAPDWMWQNPLPTGNSLLQVWGGSGSDVFAVGHSGTILHYNGASWSIMDSGTSNWLSGIWGS